MATSAKWLNISAGAVDSNHGIELISNITYTVGVLCLKRIIEIFELVASLTSGLIWTQQPNNAIFCFPAHNKKFSEVSPPDFNSPFVCISATKEAVWGLLGDGQVLIRGGMATHCPQGIKWISLDLIQLGKDKKMSLFLNIIKSVFLNHIFILIDISI